MRRIWSLVPLLSFLLLSPWPRIVLADDAVLVRVDGRPITTADLELELAVAGVPDERRAAVERRYLKGLVEARLLEGFLRSRRIRADEKLVDREVKRIRQLLGGEDADRILAKRGLDEAALRRKLALPIAWDSYVRTIVRPAEVQAYWEKHRRRFDGTRITAAQILRKVPRGAGDEAPEVKKAFEMLAQARAEITAGDRTFGDAARALSQAPSGASGGSLGTFPYRGRMPVSFTSRMFDVEPGAMSQPFRSPFGVHLVRVEKVEPGEYSLEDARPQVFKALADEVRAKLIAAEREKVEIEWTAAE